MKPLVIHNLSNFVVCLIYVHGINFTVLQLCKERLRVCLIREEYFSLCYVFLSNQVIDLGLLNRFYLIKKNIHLKVLVSELLYQWECHN